MNLMVRSDIRSYTFYVCRRCGVQSGSPDGRCDAAQSDWYNPTARQSLHVFVPVEVVPGDDFLRVEAERDELRERNGKLLAANIKLKARAERAEARE